MAVKPLILLALVMVVLGTPQGANAAQRRPEHLVLKLVPAVEDLNVMRSSSC
jgi:hypothetical protein